MYTAWATNSSTHTHTHFIFIYAIYSILYAQGYSEVQGYNISTVNSMLTRNNGKYTRIQRGYIVSHTPTTVLQQDLSQGWHTSQHSSLTLLQLLNQLRDKLITSRFRFYHVTI